MLVLIAEWSYFRVVLIAGFFTVHGCAKYGNGMTGGKCFLAWIWAKRLENAGSKSLRNLCEATVNPFYTDIRYNDKIRYNNNMTVTKPSP